MEHPIYHITEFEITAPYTLRIKFNDDTEQTIDFEPILHGEIYSPLRDLGLFQPGETRPRSADSGLAERCRFRSRRFARLA